MIAYNTHELNSVLIYHRFILPICLVTWKNSITSYEVSIFEYFFPKRRCFDGLATYKPDVNICFVDVHFRKLRSIWDELSDDLQREIGVADQCLLKLAEFNVAQDELTAWLSGVENSINQGSELCSTLQEKLAQFQV